MEETRICKKCGIEKELNIENFYIRKKNNKFYNFCIKCIKFKSINYKKDIKLGNRTKKEKQDNIIKIDNILYRKCKKCNEIKKLDKYNFEYIKNYNTYRLMCKKCKYLYIPKNKEKITDSSYLKFTERFKDIIKNTAALNRKNIFNILGYSKKDLKIYLESLFEPWMNWSNYGHYLKNKNNADKLWQIHHINNFDYNSIDHSNFKKHWSLENIKPYQSNKSYFETKTNIKAKTCPQCNIEKNINDFYFNKINIRRHTKCKECSRINNRLKYKQDKNIRKKKNIYEKNKKQNDPYFKIHKMLSGQMRIYLKKQNLSKQGRSVFEILNYTREDFKTHIESLFEDWMDWKNHGIYKASVWDDNNLDTWKWNIDHIIPASSFKYDSIEHPNFKKCWDLNNLRPYSAKKNILDSNKRTEKIIEIIIK